MVDDELELSHDREGSTQMKPKVAKRQPKKPPEKKSKRTANLDVEKINDSFGSPEGASLYDLCDPHFAKRRQDGA